MQKIDNDTRTILNPDKCKQIILQILINFDAFCKEHKLTYYLSWGTLIGAVRHRGFIPWDDDIDVSMPRSDYNKLIELSKNWNLPYEFISYETNPDYPHYFGKVCDKSTTLKNYYMNEIGDLGLFVDVFPIDFITLKSGEQCKLEKKMEYEIRMQEMSGMKRFWPSKSKVKSAAKYLLFKYSVKKGVKYWQNKHSQLIFNYADSPQSANFCLSSFRAMPKEWFGDGVDLEFEGHMFKAPAQYDNYLKNVYGNYMELPPQEQRVSVHDYDVFLKNN